MCSGHREKLVTSFECGSVAGSSMVKYFMALEVSRSAFLTVNLYTREDVSNRARYNHAYNKELLVVHFIAWTLNVPV